MGIDWQQLDLRTTHTVPARPDSGIWSMVRTQLSAPVMLRIEASGRWRIAPELPECGPDGLRHWAYTREGLLTKKAPLGALVGKLGGSNLDTEDSAIFVVGSSTVLQLDKSAGPLYLAINAHPMFFASHAGTLSVDLS